MEHSDNCVQFALETLHVFFDYICRYHGNISREETDRIMGDSDGAYLVRKSERAPDAFTLAIKYVDKNLLFSHLTSMRCKKKKNLLWFACVKFQNFP